jgi:hypothetical protein
MTASRKAGGAAGAASGEGGTRKGKTAGGAAKGRGAAGKAAGKRASGASRAAGAARGATKATGARKAPSPGSASGTADDGTALVREARRQAVKAAARTRAENTRLGSFEDLFRDHPPHVKVIGAQLREIVHRVLPRAEETVYTGGWNVALYREKGEICGIQPHRDHCNLLFSHGTSLDDPHGLLEGTGKSMRHVKLRSAEGVPERALTALLEESRRLANA